MLEIAARLLDALDAGRPLVVATVVGLDGSGPRQLGTSMAWDGSQAIGSVAGGCVESATVDVADRVLEDGRTRVIEFGVPDEGPGAELALAVGLSCGGRIRLHLALVDPARRGEGDVVLRSLRRAAAGLPARITLTSTGYDTAECADPVFLDTAEPPARLVIVGAMEFSAALSRAARAIGYAVTILDPRPVFATPERFPGAEIVVGWPPLTLAETILGPRDAVCLLSHDDRFDPETILLALRSPAFYVGAMGSRRTHQQRLARLRDLGASTAELARLHGPIGLDLGAVTPDEVAVSILAELLQVRSGASARSLRELSGRIHAPVTGQPVS